MVLNDDFMSVKHDVDEMKKKQKQKIQSRFQVQVHFITAIFIQKRKPRQRMNHEFHSIGHPRFLIFFLLHICI